jgi:5'-nucleotidase (lipoprotein e(P4) family)
MANRFFILLFAMLACVSCTTTPVAHSPEDDLGLSWVKHAAEYGAITTQVYQAAELALPNFIADQSWTAMPGQDDAQGLRPAVILDVDETVVSNIDFQISFERPFTNRKLYDFYQQHPAIPVPGVVEFVAAARAAGVTVFFVTNRPCQPIVDNPDPCPQKEGVIHELESIGIDVDATHVMLADQNGWDRAKITRREHIAESYRVIMLIGDDLGDFVPCVRKKLYGPCEEPATKESRESLVAEFSQYWGNGWYILPGPTHGSWTSFN